MDRVPLFVTRYSSTAPQTAIGLQTCFLMEPFQRRLHLHWTTNSLRPNDRDSIRAEYLAIARLAFLRYSGAPFRLIERLGLTWWVGDSLRPSRRRTIERLGRRVSHVYVAPIDASDAARMRRLVETLDRPFLVHLWDWMSGPLESDPNLMWLLRNARKALVLSRPLMDELTRLGIASEFLLFTRPASKARAGGPPVGKVRVAVLGHLAPYQEGVVAMDKAIDLLGHRGVEVEWVSIGRQRDLDFINPRLTHQLKSTGFLSDDARDARLAECHFGFVPGPQLPPEEDARSRYSIPSRSLDFLTVGLPMLGAVNPRSATGLFYKELGVGEGVFCQDPAELADALVRLSEPARWEAESKRNHSAFDALMSDSPAERLRRAMDEIAPQV